MPQNKKTKLQMTFDPLVIDDLGAKLYSTLPPIISELIANGYDACAKKIFIELTGTGEDKKIIITDDGFGMSFDEIDDKYLRIGRKRRDVGDEKIECDRLPMGKKGLGKLAFFGIAKKAVIKTINTGEEIIFEMDWDKIQSTPEGKDYEPIFSRQKTTEDSGTEIILSEIDRKSAFKTENLKISISNYFIFDEDFRVFIKDDSMKDFEEIDNEIRYQQGDRGKDFSWSFPKIVKKLKLEKEFPFAKDIEGKIILFNLPVKNNLRGVTLFSRKKLVSLPESFPVHGSSHFYQYLTGWLEIDFIDNLKPDVIATNRSSLNWNDENLEQLQLFLEKIINYIHREWRILIEKRKENKIKKKYGVDIPTWRETNKNNPMIIKNIDKLTKVFKDPEKIGESEAVDVLGIIYSLAPKNADFVLWSGLHERIKENKIIKRKFFNEEYLEAAREAVQIFNEEVQNISKRKDIGYTGLVSHVFGKGENKLIWVTNQSNQSEEDIDEGQKFLSMGIMTGFRNPALGHTSLTKAEKIKHFTDRNCLDILSTISYLFDRLENRKKPKK